MFQDVGVEVGFIVHSLNAISPSLASFCWLKGSTVSASKRQQTLLGTSTGGTSSRPLSCGFDALSQSSRKPLNRFKEMIARGRPLKASCEKKLSMERKVAKVAKREKFRIVS